MDQEAAVDLGVHPEALRGWIRQAEEDAGERDDRLTTDERAELAALRSTSGGTPNSPGGSGKSTRIPAGCAARCGCAVLEREGLRRGPQGLYTPRSATRSPAAWSRGRRSPARTPTWCRPCSSTCSLAAGSNRGHRSSTPTTGVSTRP
ncbi:transposase [Streptomyces sp. NPDC021098]|uniref:transposase n=1 Tax=unclassified Streptomyces TaxID=2593676 RepID=UPI0037BC8789